MTHYYTLYDLFNSELWYGPGIYDTSKPEHDHWLIRYRLTSSLGYMCYMMLCEHGISISVFLYIYLFIYLFFIFWIAICDQIIWNDGEVFCLIYCMIDWVYLCVVRCYIWHWKSLAQWEFSTMFYLFDRYHLCFILCFIWILSNGYLCIYLSVILEAISHCT